jgi:hypothetical protein
VSDRHQRLAVAVALGATLVLLLAHAARYAFLTDDAFISFRYAENFARGNGLVFNAGQERVEGYSNFLWVVLLAAGRVVGAAPENAAPILSLLATVALWGLVVRFEWRRRESGPLAAVLVAPLLLAATRSVAVWSTSGLETRFFELCVVAGTLAAVHEHRRPSGSEPPIPLSAIALALGALTRPDGILIGGCVIAASWILAPKRSRGVVARGAGVFAAVVSAHFLARHAYYGAWLPNTYYAKVGGDVWWSMGAAYLGSWFLEYGGPLWIVPLAFAIRAHRARRTLAVPLLFGAVVVPHALYVASIGGDHFEYRPLDLYFPFVYLLVADGLREIARRSRTWIAFATGAIVLAGVWAVPDTSHRQFPDRYATGFPGRAQNEPAGRAFLDPSASPWTRWPGIATVAELQRSLLNRTTAAFVGIRQEEHAAFLANEVEPEGRAMRTLVEEGVIAPDAYIAIDCVGAIPYYGGLLVLDRLGLNDAHVARGERARGSRRLAHEKRADLAYARERGVHFWTLDPVHTIWSPTDERFLTLLARARERDLPAWVGVTPGGEALLGMAPAGIDTLRAHFPGVRFVEASDPSVAERLRVP